MLRRALVVFATCFLVVTGQRAAFTQRGATAASASPPAQKPAQTFTRTSEVGGVLPPSARQYAAIDERQLTRYVQDVVSISRRYRDNGHPQFWGRIIGTEADVENARWIMDKFRQIGLADVRDQSVPLQPQWRPQSWAVTASAGGKTIDVATAQPTYASPGTPTEGLDLEAVYVGMGSDADLALSPDVRGKAAFFYSADPTARTAGSSNDAYRRISDRGAAAVFGIIAIPGNMRVQMYPVNSKVPSFAVGLQDGLAVRDLIARNRSTPVRVRDRIAVP